MRYLLSVAVLVVWVGVLNAATINVPADQPTIQAGIDAAVDGDTVLVAPGTYNERIHYNGKNILLAGQYGLNQTIIDAAGLAGDIIQFAGTETRAATFRGFTLTGPIDGRGVFTADASPVIDSNFFTGITTTVYEHFVVLSSGGSPLISHNVFNANDAWGLIYTMSGSSSTVVNNTLNDNTLRGLLVYGSGSLVLNNIISNCGEFGFFINSNLSVSYDYNNVWGNTFNYYGGTAPGPHDLSANPQYVDQASGDLSLLSSSPCIDAGDPDPMYDDPDGTRNDMGAFYFNQAYEGLTWYVSTSGNDTTGSGSELTPFATIQHAIDASSDGDTVLVLPGIYSGDGNHDISTLGKAILVMGEMGADSTTIDGEGAYNGFTIRDDNLEWNIDSSTVLCGLSLLNCVRGVDLRVAAPLMCDLTIQDCSEGVHAGGGPGPLVFRDCLFISNGVGIRSNPELLIEDCQFIDNGIGVVSNYQSIVCRRTLFKNSTIGITCEGTPPTSGYVIDSCLFVGNNMAIKGECVLTNSTFRDGVGALSSFGSTSNVNVDNCVFENLSGTVFHSSTSMRVYNSVIRNNLGLVGYADPPSEGTGLLELHNCQVTDNVGGIGSNVVTRAIIGLYNTEYVRNGGGISCKSSTSRLSIDSSTIASIPGTALEYMCVNISSSFLTVKNSVIASNSGYGLRVISDTTNLTVEISCNDFFANDSGNFIGIADQTGLNGNISEDPLFCDTTQGDYSLFSTSPCVPSNNNCSMLMGALDVGCSIGPPVVSLPSDTTITEMDSLTLAVSATSPDNVALVILAGGLPGGAIFTDNQDGTGSFDWQTDNFDEGEYEVWFVAANPMDSTLRDSQVVAITVLDSNLTPIFYIDPPQQIDLNEGDTICFTVSASDPDSTIPTLIAVDLPPGATFVDSGKGTGLFCWTPSYDQAGVYSVTFIASDGFLSDSETVQITVTEADPVVLSIQIDGFDPALNVTSHTPLVEWSYTDPLEQKAQTQVEVAVGTDADWEYAEMWNPAPFQTPDTFVTYAGSELLDGETYYLRLRVNNGVAWSEWYETSFRMNSVPSVPVPLSPVDDVETDNQPWLWVQNSSDPEGDTLTYDYEVYDDPAADFPVASAYGIPEQLDTTGWMVDIALIENEQYFWLTRSNDQYEYSDWSGYESFWVNGTPEPPTAPHPQFPPDTGGLPVFVMLPTFSWSESLDPDPLDTVRYTLEIATDSNFTFVQTIDSLTAVMHSVTDSLTFGTRYWWRVTAFDNSGLSTMSPTAPDFWTWVPGDLDHSHAVDISDLVMLVDYMFNSGPAPYPIFVAEIDGSCGLTISDLVHLVDYMFTGGPPPAESCE